MPDQSLMELLLPEGELRVIRCELLDKLLACNDGDSALLYLYTLRHGAAAEPESARRTLGLSEERYERALFTLTQLTIVTSAEAPDKAPSYTVAELNRARSEDPRFSAICEEAELALGGPLKKDGQLRTLFTIYNHLGLPAEVIMELLGYLRRENGQVRMTDLRRVAYSWADMGIYTVDAVHAYLASLDAEKPLTDALLRIIGAGEREPKPMEKRLVSFALAHGFPLESLELALQRTLKNRGAYSIRFTLGVLKSWDKKGVHTLSEITAIEPETTEHTRSAPTDPSALADWERDWLAETRREQGVPVAAEPVERAAAAPAEPAALSSWEEDWLAETRRYQQQKEEG